MQKRFSITTMFSLILLLLILCHDLLASNKVFRYYETETTAITWSIAEGFCRNLQGQLAVVRTSDNDDFERAIKQIPNDVVSVWIGSVEKDNFRNLKSCPILKKNASWFITECLIDAEKSLLCEFVDNDGKGDEQNRSLQSQQQQPSPSQRIQLFIRVGVALISALGVLSIFAIVVFGKHLYRISCMD